LLKNNKETAKEWRLGIVIFARSLYVQEDFLTGGFDDALAFDFGFVSGVFFHNARASRV
jgi:hypothetical protein